MAIEKESLTAPINGDNPCGPFLEIDERLSRGKAVIGEALRYAEFKRFPGRFPDESMRPPEVARPEVDGAIKGLVEFLNASRDLRAMSLLVQGLSVRGRLDEAAAVLAAAVELIGAHWDTLNPNFPESAYDTAAERIDPLRPLNDGERLWWPIRETKLIEHPRLGTFTIGDLAPRAKPDENTPPFPDGFDAAVAEFGRDGLKGIRKTLSSFFDSLGQLEKTIASSLRAQGGEAEEVPAPEFDEARAEIKKLVEALTTRIGPEAEEEEEAEEAAEGGGGGGPKVVIVQSATISNRDDVLRVLQSLMDYYAKSEPGSPVPLLLGRARNLVGKDFFEILSDLAPETVAGINKLAGRA